jgi:hypothetical protein
MEFTCKFSFEKLGKVHDYENVRVKVTPGTLPRDLTADPFEMHVYNNDKLIISFNKHLGKPLGARGQPPTRKFTAKASGAVACTFERLDDDIKPFYDLIDALAKQKKNTVQPIPNHSFPRAQNVHVPKPPTGTFIYDYHIN